MPPINEILGVIAIIIAAVGVVLCNRKLRMCFLVWLVSNVICGIIHYHAGIWSLFVKDIVFFVLSIEGYFRWGKKKK